MIRQALVLVLAEECPSHLRSTVVAPLSSTTTADSRTRIGELSRLTGVSVRSLRYYEEQGLLASSRTPSGQRLYAPEAVDRVIRIQELLAAGLCSTGIAEVLPCLDAPPEERTAFLRDRLSHQRQRLDDDVRDLIRARDVLDEVVAEVDASAAPS